jgi:hypothetical protein
VHVALDPFQKQVAPGATEPCANLAEGLRLLFSSRLGQAGSSFVVEEQGAAPWPDKDKHAAADYTLSCTVTVGKEDADDKIGMDVHLTESSSGHILCGLHAAAIMEKPVFPAAAAEYTKPAFAGSKTGKAMLQMIDSLKGELEKVAGSLKSQP